ncbi:MAG TPA: adenylate/guanylate cyclase domain-containing protein [Solirubrobacteraceae bacterium]|nr:adenylate/guanylate cyclase domain-containing protein [Solirubrobacteraceae bacterium]
MFSTTAAPVELPAAAFLFADVVSFTAYTEDQGDAAAAQLAWRLRLGVERELGADAHVVKSLGDAVMVRIADAADAAAAGTRIASRALPAPDDPQVRVGIHYGPAVECDGDFFGAAVNVAARVAALAGSGEVLVTDALARAAGERGLRGRGVALETVGERALRNVARPVLLHGAVAREQQCERRARARARTRGSRPLAARTELAHA